MLRRLRGVVKAGRRCGAEGKSGWGGGGGAGRLHIIVGVFVLVLSLLDLEVRRSPCVAGHRLARWERGEGIRSAGRDSS